MPGLSGDVGSDRPPGVRLVAEAAGVRVSLYLLTAMVFTLLYLWRLGLFGHQEEPKAIGTMTFLPPKAAADTAAPKERVGG